MGGDSEEEGKTIDLVFEIMARLRSDVGRICTEALMESAVAPGQAMRARRVCAEGQWGDPLVRDAHMLAGVMYTSLRALDQPLLTSGVYDVVLHADGPSAADRERVVLETLTSTVECLDGRMRALAEAVLQLLQEAVNAPDPQGRTTPDERIEAVASRYGDILLRPRLETICTLRDYSRVVSIISLLLRKWRPAPGAAALPEPVALPAPDPSPQRKGSGVLARPASSNAAFKPLSTAQSSPVLHRTAKDDDSPTSPSSPPSTSSAAPTRPDFDMSHPREKMRATIYDALDEFMRDFRGLQEHVVAEKDPKALISLARAVSALRKSPECATALAFRDQ